MLQLVGTNTLDEALLKELFMNRLPAGVKLVLAAAPHDMSLESLAAMADRVVEATGTSVHAVHQASTPTTTSLAALEQNVASLALAVEKLAKQAHHSRGRSQHRTRGRSPTPARESSELCYYHQKFGYYHQKFGYYHQKFCYYHQKFGDATYACRPPCSKQGNSGARHQGRQMPAAHPPKFACSTSAIKLQDCGY